MIRVLFSKTGNAVWISHLDLMRLFQRGCKRAGLPLKHTQGYNPRPSVSIALPLSVGVESLCELLDFELEGEIPGFQEIQEGLNRSLPQGIRVLQVYEGSRKIREIATLRCAVSLEYDKGIPGDGEEKIRALFSSEALPVEKKGKNGPVEQDIIPMIRSLEVRNDGENTLILEGEICCQNPSLNPMQLANAVERYLPEMKPDHVRCCRLEIYDGNGTIFR